MGKHKEWRKIAKRERRRRIRTQIAKEKDKIYDSVEYLQEQEILETIQLEMIESTNARENEKWLQAERIAIRQWELLQEKKNQLRQERLQKEAKRVLEWEMEQKKKKAEEEQMRALEEQNRLKQEKFMSKLEEFLSGDSQDPPPELLISHETKPEMALCPFFNKTGCCRFGDACSRNHQYPGITKVLLAPNFFVHFGMENSRPSEYDTDIMLEYEEIETYKQFREFFFDVVEEFEKFGKIVTFKVCNNLEKHLRGNVYIEYEELRCAVAAYRALHTRWYGGRQLSLQFTLIQRWKGAICGLQFNKCPKGRACNYLHVFKNPNNQFTRYDTGERDNDRSSRSWRWSESPELDIARRSDNDKRDRRKSRSSKSRRCLESPELDIPRRSDNDKRDRRKHRDSRSLRGSVSPELDIPRRSDNDNHDRRKPRYDTRERDNDRPWRSLRGSVSPELDIPRRSDNDNHDTRKSRASRSLRGSVSPELDIPRRSDNDNHERRKLRLSNKSLRETVSPELDIPRRSDNDKRKDKRERRPRDGVQSNVRDKNQNSRSNDENSDHDAN